MADQRQISMLSVIARSKEPVTAEIDGTVVMLSLNRGKYFGLDAVGTRVWDLIEEPVSIGRICELLLNEFDVDAETCQRDVIELVDAMVGEELVQVVNESAA